MWEKVGQLTKEQIEETFRCPECGYKPLTMIVVPSTLPNSIHFETVVVCPRCGAKFRWVDAEKRKNRR